MAATSTSAGVILGYWLSGRLIRAAIVQEKAAFEIQRDELSRITEGIRQGWMDSAGQPVKLLTSSKLRSLPDKELEKIALDRGLLTMQRLGDRDALITAIESQQRSWIHSGKLVGMPQERDVMAEAIARRTPEQRQELIDEGILEEGEYL